MLQHKKLLVDNFVMSREFLDLLATHAEISFPADSKFLKYPETDTEIRLLCEDLKVLGKKDFRILLKWRQVSHQETERKKKKKDGER